MTEDFDIDEIQPGDEIVWSWDPDGTRKRVVDIDEPDAEGAVPELYVIDVNWVGETPSSGRGTITDVGQHIPRDDRDDHAGPQPLEEPDPPADAPGYAVDPLSRQDSDTLRAIADYARALAAWKDRDLDEDEIDIGEDEELVDVQEDSSSGGTIVVKKVPCGKSNCSKCPHGPYRYRNYRDGSGSVKTEYLGPASE